MPALSCMLGKLACRLTLPVNLPPLPGPQQPSAKEQQAVAAATQAITAIMTNLAKRVPKSTWLAALPQLISRMCHPCKEVSELARHIIILITQVRLRRPPAARSPGCALWVAFCLCCKEAVHTASKHIIQMHSRWPGQTAGRVH